MGSIFMNYQMLNGRFQEGYSYKCWEMTRQERIFREIKFFSNFLAKTVLSRNFCQKSVEVNFA